MVEFLRTIQHAYKNFSLYLLKGWKNIRMVPLHRGSVLDWDPVDPVFLAFCIRIRKKWIHWTLIVTLEVHLFMIVVLVILWYLWQDNDRLVFCILIFRWTALFWTAYFSTAVAFALRLLSTNPTVLHISGKFKTW